MLNVVLATGIESLNHHINQKIIPLINGQVIANVFSKDELISTAKTLRPDLIIVAKVLSGANKTILETLLEIHNDLPEIRIIYLAGQLDMNNKEKVLELGTLVTAGIYDIIHEKKLSVSTLIDLIQHPRTRDDVQYLLKYMKTNQVYEDEVVEFEEEIADGGDVEENGYENIVLVSSIKPGTGKSFVSTNVATAIAKFGKEKPDGTKPRVALIEGDLQNLSVGTLLGFEDDEKYNLKTVMDAISKVFTPDGHLIEDATAIKKTNEQIINSFKPYYNVKNLFALVGSQFRIEELDSIKPEYYAYLIEVVKDYFDVIVIDTNSSLLHVSTLPLLQLCNKAYYVINLDFNNIRNNKRYQKTLQDLNVFDKVKYIINEDIDRENRRLIGQDLLEDMQYNADMVQDAGFNTLARIPEIPKELFLNRLYQATPIILDDTDYTLKARIEISKIAGEVWEIENFEELNLDYKQYKERVNAIPKKKKGFFK